MDVTRISAIDPPDTGRSQWARELLVQALDAGLTPVIVSPAHLTSFTAPLPSHVAAALKAQADFSGLTMALVSAGLIEAARQAGQAVQSGPTDTPAGGDLIGIERVRPLLHNLLRNTDTGITQGKVVFAEAATGSGKSRMIAALAANATARGDTVVICAPLAVTWQLLAELEPFEAARTAGVNLILGRANFVSPPLLRSWADETGNDALIEWIDAGGPPLTEHTRKAAEVIEKPLCWLMDDARTLAEDLPLGDVMLPNVGDDCEAEVIYQALRGSQGGAAILICSHYMLASHVRQAQLRGLTDSDDGNTGSSLPLIIDTLVVDEAHDLENAFAAINQHRLHWRPIIRTLETLSGKKAKPLINALHALAGYASQAAANRKAKEGDGPILFLADTPELAPLLTDIGAALASATPKRDATGDELRPLLNTIKVAVDGALSGRMAVRFDMSPVRHYPQMLVGRSNLDKAFRFLWDNVAGAALVSATLYSDDKSAKLTRWKLAIPAERCLYLPPVAPTWATSLVRLQDCRVPTLPDDSPRWLDEVADTLQTIANQARGGVLALCTSYATTEAMQERLGEALGKRLIVQGPAMGASMCADQYRALYRAGIKPVWIGLGAAWTGIDLSDAEAPAHTDMMLSDLVIIRLPVGLNRSLTHMRRVAIAGFGVISQEAAWQLRQGLGRMVRRDGVPPRTLWVLDARIDKTENWVKPFRSILARYPKAE